MLFFFHYTQMQGHPYVYGNYFFLFQNVKNPVAGGCGYLDGSCGMWPGDCGYPDDSAGYLGILNILE